LAIVIVLGCIMIVPNANLQLEQRWCT